MKKRILLFTLAAAFGSIVFSSYSDGPVHDANGPFDCTGAEAAGTGAFTNPTGCSVTGGSCHASSSTTEISIAIELDSAGVATTHYKPGHVYTVKITGANGSSLTLPKYGFQLAALKGIASASTNADAGTWATTGLPAGTHLAAPTAHTQLNVIEHSMALTATGTTFTQSFTWTAPVSNTFGSVTFWSAANFVNGNGDADASDKWNTSHLRIDMWPSALSVGGAAGEIAIKAFPNPVVNTLNLQLDNAQAGSYSLQVFNLNGSSILSQGMEVNGATQTTGINTSNWAPGIYNVVVEKDGSRNATLVVKQ